MYCVCQAVSELEKAVEDVLKKSETVTESTDIELTAAERAELIRVMNEEGRERVKEGRRWRILMSQYEAKCHRERRIKSRRFITSQSSSVLIISFVTDFIKCRGKDLRR